jgi:4-amino-4-deoxy-L-arabinose transferase-like glycosyltransferase
MTALPVDRAARWSVATWLIAFLTAYFALQALLRLFAVSSLPLDDAEMVVITQTLARGYGSQPPLYNWLQIAFFTVFGFGAPAIVLLHFILLWAVYVLVFLSARIVFDDELKAAAVSLALFAIPQIGWESLHSHTHTLLSLTLAAATLYAMLRVLANGSWGNYALLGLCFALGVLAKYSYVPFALALLIAGATIPAFRPRLFSLKMAAGIVLALILLSPHLHWVWTHLDETLSRTGKFKMQSGAGIATSLVRSFAAAIVGVIGYVALPVAIYAAAAFLPLGEKAKKTAAPTKAARRGLLHAIEQPARHRPPDLPGLPHGRAFVTRALLVALGIVLIAVLATGATTVKERWLQPVLFLLPLVLMVLAEPRLNRAREMLLIAFPAGIGMMFMVAMAVAYLAPDLHRGPFRAAAPFATIAADLRQLGFEDGYVLAENHYIGGNLRLHIPGVTVAEPEYGLWPVAEGGKSSPVLVAWTGRKETPSKGLRQLLDRLCGPGAIEGAEVHRLKAPYEHAKKARFELKAILVQDCPATP